MAFNPLGQPADEVNPEDLIRAQADPEAATGWLKSRPPAQMRALPRFFATAAAARDAQGNPVPDPEAPAAPSPATISAVAPASAQRPAPPVDITAGIGRDVSSSWGRSESGMQDNAKLATARGAVLNAAAAPTETVAKKRELDQAVAKDETKLAADEEQAQRDQDAQAHEQHQGARKLYDASMSELQRQSDEFSKRNWGDMFANKSVGATILGSLSIGLGGFAGAMRGTPNEALGIIRDGLHREYQAKRASIEDADRKAGRAERNMSLVDIELKNEQLTMERKLLKHRGAVLSKHLGGQADIANDVIANGIQADIAKKEYELEKDVAHQVQVHAGGSSSNSTQQQAQYQANVQAAQAGAAAQGNIVYANGKPLFRAADDKQAKEASEGVQALQEVLTLADELKTSFKHGRALAGDSGALQKDRDRIHSLMIGAINRAEKFGALDKGAQDILGKIVPREYGTTGTGPAQLDNFIATSKNLAAKKLGAYGVDGARAVALITGAPQAAAPAAMTPQQQNIAIARLLKENPPGSPGYDRAAATIRGMRGIQ